MQEQAYLSFFCLGLDDCQIPPAILRVVTSGGPGPDLQMASGLQAEE